MSEYEFGHLHCTIDGFISINGIFKSISAKFHLTITCLVSYITCDNLFLDNFRNVLIEHLNLVGW